MILIIYFIYKQIRYISENLTKRFPLTGGDFRNNKYFSPEILTDDVVACQGVAVGIYDKLYLTIFH